MMFDNMEVTMDEIDSIREKKIFNQRLRNEWMDAFVKRYIQMQGDVGTALMPNELKGMNVLSDTYLFFYEKLRL